MNPDKAYILGLLVGGGKLDKNTFLIDLPLKKWGMDATRMNDIATDILTNIRQRFSNAYNTSINYTIGNGKWIVYPMGDFNISPLLEDLKMLKLPTIGLLLDTADLSGVQDFLSNMPISAENFLSGIFDARASLALTHRRFVDTAPVVSIEIPGSTKNFRFVVQLCAWLTSMGSITDQILYNHPNQHSGADPDYRNWKKGFKIRFLVKSFLSKHSFALKSKSKDIEKIEKSQSKDEQIPCILRKLKQSTPIPVHSEQNSLDLPEEVRSKLFFHYQHFCAALGCPYAPKEEVENLVKQKKRVISFFPVLQKDTKKSMTSKLKNIQQKYYPESILQTDLFTIQQVISNPIFEQYTSLHQGIAYLFAKELNGKRYTGSMDEIINQNLKNNIQLMSIDRDFTNPLLVSNPSNDRAFICSTVSNNVNQKLIDSETQTDGIIIKLKNDE